MGELGNNPELVNSKNYKKIYKKDGFNFPRHHFVGNCARDKNEIYSGKAQCHPALDTIIREEITYPGTTPLHREISKVDVVGWVFGGTVRENCEKISMESDRPTEIKSTKSKMLKPTENNFKITENDSTKFGILMLENRAKDSCIILNIDKKKCLEVNTQRELVLAEY